MKRFSLILSALIFALLTTACLYRQNPQNDSGENMVTLRLYYETYQLKNELENIISFEERDFIADDGLLEELISVFFEGPKSVSLLMPFPSGTKAEDFRLEEGRLYIRMDSGYQSLDGIEKTIADACLTMTMVQLEGVNEVIIYSEAGNQQDTISFAADSIILVDESSVGSEESVYLYFAGQSGRYLFAERRQIVAADNISIEKYVVEELIRGPSNGVYLPTIPEGTKALSVNTENGVCRVDLSQELTGGKSKNEIGERLTIYSIVNSLTGIEGVDTVNISVNGVSVQYYGRLRLADRLERYEEIIGLPRTSTNYIDADLYVKSWSEEHLARVPVIIPIKSNVATEKLILEALINFTPVQGYSSPVPAGTRVNSTKLSDRVVTVDLSSEFIDNSVGGEAAQRLSINSIVTTMCALEVVDEVVITIDGEETDHKDYPMKGRLRTTADMFYPWPE